MALKFKKFYKGIILQELTADPSDNIEGSVWFNTTTDFVKGYFNGAVRTLVSADQVQTLTNKTLDGDLNTVIDLALASLKTDLANADNFLSRDGSGAVVSTKAVPSGEVVGDTDAQTLTNKTIDGDVNTVQDLALSSLKTVLADANKILARDGSGIVVSTNTTPSGTIVGTTDTQTLSNKSLVDNSTLIVDNSDPTKTIAFDAGGTTGTKTTIAAAQTTNRTISLPDATDTLVGKATTDVLTNKTIDGDDNTVQDLPLTAIKTVLADASKFLARDASGIPVSTNAVPTGTVVGTSDTQTLSNKALVDNSTTIVDNGDATKKIAFDAAGTTGTKTTITGSQTTDRVLTLPDATDTLVGKATTDVLTNKTIDGDNNTVQDLPLTAIKTDLGAANTFLSRDGAGVPISTKAVPTGTVVGTSDTQTLTNKSLSAPTTSIVDSVDPASQIKFDVSSFFTPSITTIKTSASADRTFNLPDATTTAVGTDVAQTLTLKTFNDELTLKEISDPATPSSPYMKVYGKTDHRLYIKDFNGNVTVIGSGTGSGGINYDDNPDFESNANGYVAYADAAGASPVDGTGGSPTTTITRSTSTPLRGTGSGLITKDAANRQGEGVSYDFTIDEADKATMINVSYDYNPSAAFVSGDSSDLRMWAYDVTNAVLIPITPYTIQGGSANNWHFTGVFQSSSNSTSYRLIWHIATTNATAWTFKFDNVIIGPQLKLLGPPVTDATAYTPTFSAGFGTVINIGAWWKRVGDEMILWGYATAGTVTSAVMSISLPSGFSINTTKVNPVNTTANPGMIVGLGSASGGTGQAFNVILAPSTSASLLYAAGDQSANSLSPAGTSSIVGNDDNFSWQAKVPIAGWSSTTLMSNDTDSRVVSFRGQKTGTQAVTANVTNVTYVADTDTHGAWSGSVYTVPVAGDYMVSGAAIDSGATTVQTSVYKNGTVLTNQSGLLSHSANGTAVGPGSTIVPKLIPGDTISVRSSASVTLGATGSLSIYRLSGPSTIAASDTVSCKYTSATTAVGTAYATIVYPTKAWDTTGSYNSSTGIFTCPIAGKYRIICSAWNTGTITMTSSGNRSLKAKARKNTVDDSFFPYWISQTANQSPNDVSVAGSTEINCLAGDTLDVQIIRPTEFAAFSLSGESTTNFLIIDRVGN